MMVYTVTILLTSITSFISQYIEESKNVKIGSKFFAVITALVLIFVSGFRWYVGTDYASYAIAYTYYKEQVWEAIITFEEPGIRIIAAISQLVYDDYATMFLISSVITVGLFMYTIYKRSESFFLSVLLFILGHGWSESFNGIRQMLASAIIFAGHHYIIERQFRKYMLLVFLASSFHISALPLLFLYFIPQTKVTFKKAIFFLILVLIGISIYDFLFEFINMVMNFYGETLVITEYITREINILRILVMMAPPSLYLLITPKDNLSKRENFYINMLFINSLVYMVSLNSAYLARFALYTIPYIILGFPIIVKNTGKSTGVMITYVALILYLIYWYYDIITVESLYNFQWIFSR